MKQKAIICDIDGVLLDTSKVFKQIEDFYLTGNIKWKYFNRHANDNDVPCDIRIMRILEWFVDNGYKIIFLTARSEEIYRQTRAKIQYEQALYANKPFDFLLIMRPSDVLAPSDEVKYNALLEIEKKYNIFCAIDDDADNCDMFASKGILTLQVKKNIQNEKEMGVLQCLN